MLKDIPERKKRCYCLIGRESIEEAEKRLERVLEPGFLPFAQLYRPEVDHAPYGQSYKALARKYSRPAAYRGRKEK